MVVQRLRLMLEHFKTFTSLPNYKAMVISQANTCSRVSKKDIKISKISGNTRKLKFMGVKRYD